MKENKKLVEETRKKVKQFLKDKDHTSPAFENYIKNKIRNELGEFLWKKTNRRPMILPVLIEV
jgi:ribonuclease J